MAAHDHEISTAEDGCDVLPLTVPLTVYYAVQAPLVRGPELPSLLLALHGWGQNCRRFLRDFAPLKERNIVVVAPQAPHQFYLDMATKKVGFNWLTIYDRQQAVLDNNNYLLRLLEVVQRQVPYHPERVVLLGFSQGSSVAYRFAVSGSVRPAGLISCCADLPRDVALAMEGAVPFPVLLAQGNGDHLVPVEKLQEACAGLDNAGYNYETFTYDGGHRITPALVDKVGEWVEERGQRTLNGPC